MNTVAVVDYGMGNLRSVVKAVEHVARADTRVLLTGDPDEVRAADRVVFPGQGAARDCMAELSRRGLGAAVGEAAATRPFLGICMGMQVLAGFSAEGGGTDCLGIMPGTVRFLGADLRDPAGGGRLKIPHMGWNVVHQERAHPLWHGIPQETRFYFVHSYHFVPDDAGDIAATTDYGPRFVSAVAHGNLFAIQCHPEKSAAAGLTLLDNFLRWDGGV